MKIVYSGRQTGKTLRAIREAASSGAPTRPWVNAFADLMELKLGENRHKGDRNGWRAEPVSSLRRMLLQEVAELFYELDTNGVPGTAGDRKRRIQREAADASNILMMIADVAGGMKPKERG